MFRPVIAFCTLLFLTLSLAAMDDIRFDSDSFDPDKPFKASETLMADVDETILAAKSEGKMAAFILGANWCSDSRALAKHFTDPALASVLADNYKVRFIDVGYLENGIDVAKRFGQPIYYGTPTLLVIDPQTEQLTNAHNIYDWRDSMLIKIADVRQAFKDMSQSTPKSDEPAAPSLKAAFDQINAFENEQAKTLAAGFKVVGPMLKATVEGNEPDQFDVYWGELKDRRYAVTKDLQELKKQAVEEHGKGVKVINLEFPEYLAFSWE